MDTKRLPALTSPWKIGCLVSLLLILLSVGASYILFRTFNLSWSWIGLREGNWFFHKDRFFQEMLPLIVLTVLASMIAYFAITSVIRKYKAYLDSGHDYWNLIRLIEEVSDLEEENIVQGLNKYPELRDFLIGMREQLNEKEKALNEQKEALERRGEKGISGNVLKQECRCIANAISNLSKGKPPGKFKTTIPGLKPVEGAIRAVTESGGFRWGDEDKARLESIRMDVNDVGAYIEGRLNESSRELQASCAVAQEIEQQVSELNMSFEKLMGTDSPGSEKIGLAAMHQALDKIQMFSETLSDLGEEAKGIAINTALQASSGEGALADLIQLAEDVRQIAVKFIDVSQSYQEIIERMRKIVADLESKYANFFEGTTENSNFFAVTSSLKSKVSLWVERLVILADKLKNVEASVGISLGPLEEKLAGNTGDAYGDRPGVIDKEEGIEQVLQVETPSSESFVDELDSELRSPAAFRIESSKSDVFSETGAPAQEIPGLEKNSERIFTDSSGECDTFIEHSEEERFEEACGENQEVAFEELPRSDPDHKEDTSAPIGKPLDELSFERNLTGQTMDEEPSGKDTSDQQMMGEVTAHDKVIEEEKVLDLENFGTTGCEAGPAGDPDSAAVESIPIQRDGASVMEHTAPEPMADTRTGDSKVADEEKIIDLYTLGAVDFE